MLFTHGPLDKASLNANLFASGLSLCSAILDTLETTRALLLPLDETLDSPEDIEEYRTIINSHFELMLQHPVEKGV